MNNILVNNIPFEFKDKLPISAFYIKGHKKTVEVRNDLRFASSEFYTTQKMRCYAYYKPAFL